ncbi:hypothetical protein DSUL_50156 [Desulfovibrionales bacterium]
MSLLGGGTIEDLILLVFVLMESPVLAHAVKIRYTTLVIFI